MNDRLKVGVLSFAHVHGRGFASQLQGFPDVDVMTADPDSITSPADELRGRALADELGIPYVDTYEELFSWKPDAVVVTSENSKHRTLVEWAAATGAHVLCEKPLATTLQDGKAMIAACAEANVHLMMAHPVRFHPVFHDLRDRIQADELGTVLSAVGTNNGKIPTSARRWFCDRELAGGGSIIDHTVHVADLLDYIFGSDAVSVYAQANKIIHPESGAETGGLVAVTYSNGLVATIDCSWSLPRTYPTSTGLTLAIEGTAGMAMFDPFRAAVVSHDDATGQSQTHRYGATLDRLMMAEFLSSIREGRRPSPDGEAGLRTLQIVLAAYESLRDDQPVQIPA